MLISPTWLEVDERNVPIEADMYQALAIILTGTSCLPLGTSTPYKVKFLISSIAPISLVHPLVASLFLSPENVCFLITTRVQFLGMAQRVRPFLEWILASTVTPPQTVGAFSIVNLSDSTMQQSQDTRKIIVSPLPPP